MAVLREHLLDEDARLAGPPGIVLVCSLILHGGTPPVDATALADLLAADDTATNAGTDLVAADLATLVSTALHPLENR